MTTHTAHFRISGADFTRMARERLLEDAPGHAWRIASSLLNDSDEDRQDGVADAALGILNGTKKLIGDETGMQIVKEPLATTKRHMARVREIYAGRIRVDGRWYRPVAYVSDMGPRDMKNDHGKHVAYVVSQRGYTNRAWHYCGKDEIVIDLASYPDPTYPSIKREVIFRACGERPHWLEVPLTPQAALDEFLAAGHSLDERSHSKLYGTTADEIWDGVPIEPVNPDTTEVAVRAVHQRAERVKHERDGIKRGDLTAMNVRLNAELELAQELDDEAERERAEDLIEAQHVVLRKRHIEDLRDRILKQAGDDLIELVWGTSKSVDPLSGEDAEAPGGRAMIPRAPFMHWAFARMKMYEKQLPPWTPVSPTGMKMMLDDPNHTDWVIAAGFDPQDRHVYRSGKGSFTEAAMNLAHELQNKFDEPSDVHVLVDGPYASGTIHHGRKKKPSPAGAVVVLPNLHPDYLHAIEDAVGVITEEGGAVAHLAQVGRERNLPIVRIAGAIERFHEGGEVSIDTATRTVRGF